jgi:hypothetical protein
MLLAVAVAVVLPSLVTCGTQQFEVASTVVPAEPAEEWDYVAIGHDQMDGYADKLAAQIVADLGVKIVIHDYSRPGLSTAALAVRIGDNAKLRGLIIDAEVVTIVMPVPFMTGAEEADAELYASYLDGSCGGPDNQNCLREALRLYKANVEDILYELLALRSTSDAIIRAGDCWLSSDHTEDWRAQGAYEVLKPYWMSANEYAAQAAADYDIPFARLFLTMNGPDGEDVPEAYVQPGESGRFANDAGNAVIAEAFRELGYEPLAP